MLIKIQDNNRTTDNRLSGFFVGLLSSGLMLTSPVLAMEIEPQYDDSAVSQVTSVSQLKDVSPTDWAYEALRSLVERYGCIVGYPDTTFRGNRALSRYEFAAGLNACMQQMERLIAASEAVLKEDIAKLQRLMSEFEAELAALGARVDNLEGRIAFLEDHQFSTTTKLSGEVILAVGNAFGGDIAVPSGSPQTDENIDRQTFLSSRVRLKFNTSFTGQDNLHLLLRANNTPVLGTSSTGTNMTRLGFDGGADNDLTLDELWYENQVTEKFWFLIGSSDVDLDDGIFYSGPSFLEPSATGAVSRFHRRNPLTNRQLGSTGLALKYTFNDLLTLNSFYLASDGFNPSAGKGLFNGSFDTGVQLDITPTDRLDIALSYIYSYYTDERVNLTNSTGSSIASQPFGEVPTAIHNLGATVNWRANDLINLTAWGAWGNATALGGDRRNDNATLWTWQATLGFIDVGKEGAVAILGVGSPPYAPTVDGGQADSDTPISILAQYNYPLNDNIQLSPAVYVTVNPESNSANDPITVGVIRTTFKF